MVVKLRKPCTVKLSAGKDVDASLTIPAAETLLADKQGDNIVLALPINTENRRVMLTVTVPKSAVDVVVS